MGIFTERHGNRVSGCSVCSLQGEKERIAVGHPLFRGQAGNRFLVAGKLTRVIAFPAHKIDERVKPVDGDSKLDHPFIENILPLVVNQLVAEDIV